MPDRRELDRRAFVARLSSVAAVAALPGHARAAAGAGNVQRPLAGLERQFGGELGLHALDLTTGRTLSHRADQRFRLMSTFKCLLTAMILRKVADEREHLHAPVLFGPADLLDASPITTANVARGQMTVAELCEATMTRSDNTAANLLMARLGGPAAITRMLRTVGDDVTRIDDYEGPRLATAPLPRNSTTPRAMVANLHRFLVGPHLQSAARRQWTAWMAGNVVGKTRLRAAFPIGWHAGDRTGTADGICNDVAFAIAPGRAPLLVAAYHDAPGKDLAVQEQLLREVGRQVVAWQRGSHAT